MTLYIGGRGSLRKAVGHIQTNRRKRILKIEISGTWARMHEATRHKMPEDRNLKQQ